MAITSADIQNQSFKIERRGYDVDEVDVFLERVASEMMRLLVFASRHPRHRLLHVLKLFLSLLLKNMQQAKKNWQKEMQRLQNLKLVCVNVRAMIVQLHKR